MARPRRLTARAAAEVGDGLLLLEFAVRIKLRNEIVVDILTTDGAVDPRRWWRLSERELAAKADEASVSALRLRKGLRSLPLALGRGDHMHDYRLVDALNLLRRVRAAQIVSEVLRERASDPDYIALLIGEVLHDAHEEVGRAIHAYTYESPLAQPDDDRVLRERLALITEIDLPALRLTTRLEPNEE